MEDQRKAMMMTSFPVPVLYSIWIGAEADCNRTLYSLSTFPRVQH